MAISPQHPQRVFFLATLLAFAIFAITGALDHFHVSLNDFWGPLYYAEHIRWAEKASLYNGFFPIGYPLLLKLFPYESVIFYAFLLNSVFGALLVAAISSTVAAQGKYLGTTAAFLISLSYPLLFKYANTPGPDIGCAAFTGIAVWLLWKDVLTGQDEQNSLAKSLLIGSFLGLAAVWRSHAVVSSVVIILSYFLFEGIRPLRTRAGLLISFLVVYLIQILVNVLSGHGPFETAQKLTIYSKLHQGFSWYHIPSHIEESVFEILLARPFDTIEFYGNQLLNITTFAWPSILCLLFCRSNGVKRYSLFTLTSIILFALPVALGGSPRAPLVLMSLFIPPLCFLGIDALNRIDSLRPIMASRLRGLMIIVFMGGAAYWLYMNISTIQAFHNENEKFVQVEQILIERGMTSPKQVFTTSFDLYFPHIPPYLARSNGGWSRYPISTYGYNKEYPEIPTQSFGDFAEACARQGIRFLVLNPGSKQLADFLFDLYTEEKIVDAIGKTTLVAKVDPFKIFELK